MEISKKTVYIIKIDEKLAIKIQDKINDSFFWLYKNFSKLTHIIKCYWRENHLFVSVKFKNIYFQIYEQVILKSIKNIQI